MEAQIIKKFTNKDDGIESYVTKGANGYHVSLKDLDANAFVSINTICPTLEMATLKAKMIVK